MRLTPYFLLVPCALGLLFSCAQTGTLTGGLKDEKPPQMLSCVPANYTTHFNSDQIQVTFDEYFSLKDITKQLVVSPPMKTKPEFKIKGKLLSIRFADTLQPDRTYAINFGDALVDLNEGNPIKNFQIVFSTGNTIDSLETSGIVVDAVDNKPSENILVMLYNGIADSLPLKTIPLYISRTNKEGRFTLRNLAKGSYKIFALKDANTNFRFDQPAESVAFLDSLITPTVIINPVDTAKPATDSLRLTRDSLPATKDSLTVNKDSLPQKSLYRYLPDSIELRLFTEVRSNPYFSGSDRSRRDQFRLKFNEKIDSLDMEFLNLPLDSLAVSLEWTGDSDTIDFWIMNKEMASRDSMTAILNYPGYDSLERPIRKTDTTKLRYRPAAPSGKAGTAQKKEFSVTSSIDKTKTLEFNDPVIFTTTLPFVKIDTSLIRLTTGKDSVGRRLEYKLFADTLKGLVLNGLPINQTHPRILKMAAGLSSDSLYRLTLLPGAFTGINGQKSDTLDIHFKMKNQDQYGSVILSLPDLREPAIVELLDAKNKVASRRFMNGQGTAGFHLLTPGKYTARLIFDTNNNHRWDTGRYSTHVQPERVISFPKELNLKANWEVSETWQW